jgi:hypothetical protein
MDDQRFDDLARGLARGLAADPFSRRAAVRGIGAAALGGLVAWLGLDDAEAHDTMRKCRKIEDPRKRKTCLKRAKDHRAQHNAPPCPAGARLCADGRCGRTCCANGRACNVTCSGPNGNDYCCDASRPVAICGGCWTPGSTACGGSHCCGPNLKCCGGTHCCADGWQCVRGCGGNPNSNTCCKGGQSPTCCPDGVPG